MRAMREFPTHAGMNRIIAENATGIDSVCGAQRVPHTRGDEPTSGQESHHGEEFPTHAGMNRSHANWSKGVKEFPTHAGMNRYSAIIWN